MVKIVNNRTFNLAIFIALLMLASACKPSAEKLLLDGNEQFEEEAYLEALVSYQQAQFENPEIAEPYYNAANTLYREEAYPEALAMIQEALKFAEKESIAESSLYNMGNSTYNIQEFDSAVEAYKQALLLNPDDADAKYNLELALQQQQQQEQEQEQNQDEQQDQGDESQDQQDQNQEQGGQDEQDEKSGDESEEGQDEHGENQEQSHDEQDQEQEENGDEQDGQGQPQDGDGQEQEQPGQIPPPGQRMTAEQARQLLAAIAQESETLQERLGQIFVAPPVPPVQDW